MTREDFQAIAQDPKAYLLRCSKTKRCIRVKARRVDQLRRLSVQITTTLKEASAYTGPNDKVGNCVIEIIALSGEIEKEIAEMVNQQRETGAAIRALVPDTRARTVLEARYLAGLSWEEIAHEMHYAYRWVLRLHKLGLSMMQEAANGKI